MKATKQEIQMIKIFRLCKAVSKKHDENYFSIDNTPKKINKKFYFPKTGHKEFETPEETIEALEKFLAMSKMGYKYDIENIQKEIAKNEDEIADLQSTLKRNRKFYSEAIQAMRSPDEIDPIFAKMIILVSAQENDWYYNFVHYDFQVNDSTQDDFSGIKFLVSDPRPGEDDKWIPLKDCRVIK